MKAYIFYIIISINIISILNLEFLQNKELDKESKQSNSLKVTELFNSKTHKIKDIEGKEADISLFDRVSSIVSFKGPNNEHIIIGGLGARDKSKDYPYDDSYLEKNCIIRSADGGKTWTALTPKGKTDRKVYGLSTNNKGVVIAVTGDRGHPCILSSTDYGLTWKVALSNKDLGTKKSLYNSYYSKSRDLFLIPTGDYTYTTRDGIHFEKGEYSLLLARNGYSIDELDEIWCSSAFGGSVLSVLRKGAKKYEIVLEGEKGYSFSTLKYLGKGIFITIAYGYPGGNSTIYYSTSFVRKNNVLYLTIPNHNLSKGMVTMNIKKSSPMYSTMQNGLDFEVVDKNKIKMYQVGPDIDISYVKVEIRIYKDENMVKARFYKSTDYGKTWKQTSFRGATYTSGIVWSRDIIHMGNGLVYMNIPGHENKPEYECAMFVKSNNYGDTLEVTNDIVGENNEKLNAIYRSVVDIDGTILSGAQNYCRVLKIQ